MEKFDLFRNFLLSHNVNYVNFDNEKLFSSQIDTFLCRHEVHSSPHSFMKR